MHASVWRVYQLEMEVMIWFYSVHQLEINLWFSHCVGEVAGLCGEFKAFDALLDLNLDRLIWEEKLKSPVASTELERLYCFGMNSFGLKFKFILNVSTGRLSW